MPTSSPFRESCTAGSPATPQADGIVAELLTEKQAAQLCGIGTRTLWRWSRSGIAPRPVKIGRGKRPAVRYRRVELVQWIADGCPRTERRAGK